MQAYGQVRLIAVPALDLYSPSLFKGKDDLLLHISVAVVVKGVELYGLFEDFPEVFSDLRLREGNDGK